MADNGVIRLPEISTPSTPPADKHFLFIGTDGRLKKKDDAGVVTDYDSGLVYTDENAQDAVGNILTDSSTIDFTYNDGAPSITASVNTAAVDHDALLNFVGNEHINHSSVEVQTAATSGLQGGGDITASRSLSLNINGMNNLTETVDPMNDEVAIYDISAPNHKKTKAYKLLKCATDRFYINESDFIESITASGAFLATISGTGASNQVGTYGIDNSENAFGVTQLDTGTTATGRASLTTNAFTQLHVQAGVTLRMAFRFAPEALSSGTDTFAVYGGFLDNTGAGDQTDGAYFQYTDAINGGRWEATVASAGVRATIDTGVTAGISYQVFEIVLTNTTATFFIDGVQVAQHTTGLPQSGVDFFGYGWKIEKSVGTTQRNLSVDWYCFEIERTSAR